MKRFERLNNLDLLDEYCHFKDLYVGLDRTLHSDYYINYVENNLNDLKSECLRRMVGVKND